MSTNRRTTTRRTKLQRRSPSVTTRDGLFTFTWPLPVIIHSEVVDVDGVRLDEVRVGMQRALQEGYGVRCPLTGEVLRLYRRVLTVTHVKLLEQLYIKTLRVRGEFVHLRRFTGRSDGDLAKLRYWGLVEPRPGSLDDPYAIDRGFWRLTPLGRRWLHVVDTVPRHMAVFRGVCLGPWDERDRITPRDVEPSYSPDQLFGLPPGRGAA